MWNVSISKIWSENSCCQPKGIKFYSPTAGASYESPRRISGAEYAKLPHDVSSFCPGQNLLLKPKSVNLTMPNFSKNSTFSGFKSLKVGKNVRNQYSIKIARYNNFLSRNDNPRLRFIIDKSSQSDRIGWKMLIKEPDEMFCFYLCTTCNLWQYEMAWTICRKYSLAKCSLNPPSCFMI